MTVIVVDGTLGGVCVSVCVKMIMHVERQVEGEATGGGVRVSSLISGIKYVCVWPKCSIWNYAIFTAQGN